MTESAQTATVVRAVLSGSHLAGKTSLLRRQAECEFVQDYVASIGIGFKVKMYHVGEVAVKGQLWDWGFGNGDNYNYYRYAQAIGFCFAINDKESFESIHKTIEEVKTINTEAKMFLIGCKGDLAPDIANQQVIDYAEKHQLTYFRTSSLQNWGVSEAFSEMMKQGLSLKIAQLQKQKEQKASFVTLKPPCRQKCEFM